MVAYTPPSGNSKRGKEQLISYCDSLPDNLNRELILLGDFNWDIAREDNGCKKIVSDIEEIIGAEQQIKCPTRVTIHTSSIIDLILTNISNKAHFGCLNYVISNHFPVFIIKKGKS